MTMKYKMSVLNNKLTKLERAVEYCEICMKNAENSKK